MGSGDGLIFTTPPLSEPAEITGPMMARLLVDSETGGADLFLVVWAFAPVFKEIVFAGAFGPNTRIAQGWLRVSHRKIDPDLSLPCRPCHTHDKSSRCNRVRSVRSRPKSGPASSRCLRAIVWRCRSGAEVTSTPVAPLPGWRRWHGQDRGRPVPAQRPATPSCRGLRQDRDPAYRRRPDLVPAAGDPEGRPPFGRGSTGSWGLQKNQPNCETN